MSGGTAVTDRPCAEGDHPACTRAQRRKAGDTAHGARSRKAEGLVLTEDGAAGPEKRGSVSRLRLAEIAQGIEAAGPRPAKTGSVHESPARRVRKLRRRKELSFGLQYMLAER